MTKAWSNVQRAGLSPTITAYTRAVPGVRVEALDLLSRPGAER